MPLYWIAKTHDGAQRYFLQGASTPLYASLRASLAGQHGKPSDVIELDAKTARKVPKKMIGRVLTQKEAKARISA